jgi:hypothetical protein
MSVLVALKMEGRLAGAILTVLSLVGRDDEERCRDSGVQEWDIFFWAGELRQRSSAILAHKFNFVESPARVCNWRREQAGRRQLMREWAWFSNRTLTVVLPIQTPAEFTERLVPAQPSAIGSQNLGPCCCSEKVESRETDKDHRERTDPDDQHSRCPLGYPPRRGCEA